MLMYTHRDTRQCTLKKCAIYIYIHTYTNACIHAYMHKCINADMHTCIRIYIYVYIYIIHAHIHT